MILLYISFTLMLITAYYFLISFLLKSWNEHPVLVNKAKLDPSLDLSILIPARNEADNITACLDAILRSAKTLNNPIEIIVIDDHSEDNTYQLVTEYEDDRVSIIRLADKLDGSTHNAYKKLALAYGMETASSEHILQLDADVIIPESHLPSFLKTIQVQQPDLIAGPVLLTGSSQFEKFQILDMMGMMAVTAAGINSGKWHMANGANLYYKKSLVQHQESKTASGDDIVTIQALARAGRKIHFLKDLKATVRTAALPTLSSFWKQRLRWATKNKYQSSWSMKVMMVIPFFYCLMILIHPFLIYWLGSVAIVMLAFMILTKLAIDYIYLKELSGDFGEPRVMSGFWYSSVVHIIYIAVVGVASLVVRRYMWKGRRVS